MSAPLAVPDTPAPTRRGMAFQPFAGGTDVWLTPKHLLAALGEFDLDPCAVPDPARWPTARRHICLPDDGLSAPWSGRVWLNPPYGAQVHRWVSRLADHGDGIALIFARTDTTGFMNHVWRRADAVCFLQRRLVFHHSDGTAAGNDCGAPSVLVAFGRNNVEVLAGAIACGQLGAVLVDRETGWHLPASDPTLPFEEA